MNKFEKKFKLFLEESDLEDRMAPNDFSPDGDAESFDQSFEDPEMAGEFSTDPSMAGFMDKYIEEAKGWVDMLDKMAKKLNGSEDTSLAQFLNSIDNPGGPFDGIVKEAKRISSVAGDLLDLGEIIKNYILNAGRHKGQNQDPQNM